MSNEINWTDDCCGKKDYDGEIVSISTRYWPRGGGAMVFDSAKPQDGLKGYDDGRKPRADSCLLLRIDGYNDIILDEKVFEGESFEDVAAQVESWVKEKRDEIESILKSHFGQWKEEI